MTGEMTLSGRILPIGGLKEKAIGADRNHIKKIFIPTENVVDLEDVPSEVLKNIKFIPVDNYEEIIKKLTSVKGIGMWTAEMYLIFSLGREREGKGREGCTDKTTKKTSTTNMFHCPF